MDTPLNLLEAPDTGVSREQHTQNRECRAGVC